jgi:hypothetical protein
VPAARQELRREGADVLEVLAERWDAQREDGEPEVQVRPEAAVGHELLQVPIGGAEEPDVDADRLRVADPLELAALDDPQQLDLDDRRHVADLVEEQRPPVGFLEPAAAIAERAGESPLTCPNSSDSRRFSFSAEHETRMNGWGARGLIRWIASAASSLPEPLSPRIITVASEQATSSIILYSSRMARARPVIPQKSAVDAAARRESATARLKATTSSTVVKVSSAPAGTPPGPSSGTAFFTIRTSRPSRARRVQHLLIRPRSTMPQRIGPAPQEQPCTMSPARSEQGWPIASSRE